WHEHGDNDTADDDGQEYDHDGFQKGGHGRDGVVDFFVVVVGDFEQHFRERAGLLTDVHHADDHGREDAGGFQRGGDGFTLFDAVMDRLHGAADNDVAGGFAHDGKRLQNGNAAA